MTAGVDRGSSIREGLAALRKAWRASGFKFLLLLALVTGGFLLFKLTPLADFLDRDRLVASLSQLQSVWWAPLALVGLYLLISPMGMPVSPLIIAGGVVFGVFWGTLYNALGTVLGALASYSLARYLGRDFVESLTRGRLKKLEDFSVNHSFWPLVRVRFMPVPFPVVNFGAALAGVPVQKFLWASMAGLFPSMMLWTAIWALMYQATIEGRYADTLPLWALIAVVVSLAAFGPALYKAIARLLGGAESLSNSGSTAGEDPSLSDSKIGEPRAESLESQGGPPQGLP